MDVLRRDLKTRVAAAVASLQVFLSSIHFMDWRAVEAAAVFAPADRTMRRTCREWKSACDRSARRRTKEAMRCNFADALRSSLALRMAFEGDTDALERRIAEDPAFVRATYRGISAAHVAALGGELETIQLLVRCSLRPPAVFHETDEYGRTLLHFAALGGNPDVVRYCLEEGRCDRECRTNGVRRTPAVDDGHTGAAFLAEERTLHSDRFLRFWRTLFDHDLQFTRACFHRCVYRSDPTAANDSTPEDMLARSRVRRGAWEDGLPQHRQVTDLDLLCQATVSECAAASGNSRCLKLVTVRGDMGRAMRDKLIYHARRCRSADMIECCSRCGELDWKALAVESAAVGDSDTLRLCLERIVASDMGRAAPMEAVVVNDGFARELLRVVVDGAAPGHPAVTAMCAAFRIRYDDIHAARVREAPTEVREALVERLKESRRPRTEEWQARPKGVLKQQQKRAFANNRRR